MGFNSPFKGLKGRMQSFSHYRYDGVVAAALSTTEGSACSYFD
jgi:hypothetical protein